MTDSPTRFSLASRALVFSLFPPLRTHAAQAMERLEDQYNISLSFNPVFFQEQALTGNQFKIKKREPKGFVDNQT